jgi:SAM-dependent methyltransferase
VQETELKAELARLGPFHHAIDLPFGLSTVSSRELDRTRFKNLRDRLWPELSFDGKRVLDVACNCGGFSIAAATSGASYVLGFDVVEHYVEQANFLKRALDVRNVEFRQLAAENAGEELGRFDITFCFGILYHLESPIPVMRQLGALTDKVLVVDTRLDPTHPDKPYWLMNFAEPLVDKDSSATSLWRDGSCQFLPTARAVTRLLRHLGFAEIERVPATDGWGTFIARR